MTPVSEPPRRVELSAPAKINLYLGVGARRADGYHDVETVLQAISLSDQIVVEDASELSIRCEPDIGLPPEDNLVFRAATAFAEAVGHKPGVRITVRKRIPANAGLGGASTDAAAVLVGLTHLWGLDPESAEVQRRVAVALGADVPFFLTGGTALFSGRGDELVRLLPTPALCLTVLKPDEPVPTGAAYAAFDRLMVSAPLGAAEMVAACEKRDPAAVARALANNMTEASTDLAPAIGDALAWCRSVAGVLGAAMAGSGSAVFAICETPSAAEAVLRGARERGWWGSLAKSLEEGAHVVAARGCGRR